MPADARSLACRRIAWLHDAARSCGEFAKQLSTGVEKIELHVEQGGQTKRVTIQAVEAAGALAALRLAADFLKEADGLAMVADADQIEGVRIIFDGPGFTAPLRGQSSEGPPDQDPLSPVP